MKKTVFAFVLLLCVLLSACKSSTDPNGVGSIATAPRDPGLTVIGGEVAMPEFDAQNKYTYGQSSVGLQENLRYYWGKDREGDMHCFDWDGSTSHYMWINRGTAEDPHYEIFNLEGPSGVLYYNSKYWWVEQESGGQDHYLCSSENPIIGTKTRVKRLDYEDVILAYPPQEYAIHRGNLYILSKEPVLDGGETKERVSVLITPLNETERFTVLFRQIVSSLNSCTLRFVGNKVYYSVITCPKPGQPYYLSITSYDVGTGSYKTEYTEAGIQEHLDIPWITEDGEIYLGGYSYDKYEGYLWKLEDDKRVEVTAWSGQVYDAPCVYDGIAVNLFFSNGVYGCDVRDFSGNTLYRKDDILDGCLEDSWQDRGYDVFLVGGDKEKLILNVLGRTEEYTVLLYLSNSRLEPVVLWRVFCD